MKILEFLVLDNVDKNIEISDVQKHLKGIASVKSFNASSGSLLVETTSDISKVESILKDKFAQTKMIGQSSSSVKSGAAGVAIIGGSKGVRGVVRLLQDGTVLTAEGTVEGLSEGQYQVSINEYGDISNSCLSTGDPLKIQNGDKVYSGIFGNIYNDGSSETKFVLKSDYVKIANCVGRSLVVQSLQKNKVACGIVGRSAGIFENQKQLCACDGKVIWEEQVFGPEAVAPLSD